MLSRTDIAGFFGRSRTSWQVLSGLAALLALAGALAWLAAKPGMAQLDVLVYDRLLPLAAHPASDDIVIVAIDERSLAALGRWPWRRGVHAQLLSELADAGAASVLWDMFLTEPSEDPLQDIALAQAMGRVPVFLPMMAQRELHLSRVPGSGFVRPLPLFEEQARGVGHGELLLDGDGVARSLYMEMGPPQQLEPYVGLLVAGRAVAGMSEVTDSAGWQYVDRRRLSFAGPAGTYSSVSYVDVLRGRVPPEQLRGKTVLVGATASGLGDQLFTPSGRGGGVMAGVEVHANVIDQLAHGRAIRDLNRTAVAIWIACVLGAGAAALRWRPAVGLPLVLLVAAACLATSAAALGVWALWLPVSTPVIGLALSYAVWTWLGLRSRLTYLAVKAAELDAVPVGAFEISRADAAPAPEPEPRAALDLAIERTLRLQRLTESSFEALPLGVMLCDARGVIVGGNAWALRNFNEDMKHDGMPPDSLRGLRLADLLAPFRRQVRATDAGTGAALPPWLAGLVGEYLTEQGQYLQLLAAPVEPSPHEAPSGYVVVLTDLTAEREAQRQREKWNRFLSHDLRSPQVTILGLLDLDEGRSVPPQLGRSIRVEAERTLALAEEFLDVSHAWSGTYRFGPTHVPTVVLDARDQVWAAASRAQVTVDLHVDDDVEAAEAMLDGALVVRALVNLLLNAIAHTKPGSTVHLELKGVGDDLVITVRDEGVGMEPERLRQMLAGTAEASPGRVRSDGVTRSHGLGFEFARTVFSRHGARFGGQSAPGQGCTLTVAFLRMA